MVTIDKLRNGDRFKACFTGRTGIVVDAGINTTVKWDGLLVNRNEIISSKTEVEKI